MVLICTFVLFLSFSQTIARSYRGDSYVCHPLKEQISVVIWGIMHSAPCLPCPSMSACFRTCRGPAVCLGSLAVLFQCSRLHLPVPMQPCYGVRGELKRYYLAWWYTHMWGHVLFPVNLVFQAEVSTARVQNCRFRTRDQLTNAQSAPRRALIAFLSFVKM